MSAQNRSAPGAPATLLSVAASHAGESMLICGCGPSLNELKSKPDCLTIGVNDVGRHFDPDYLVVVNPRSQFPPDRFAAIANSAARAVFSQYTDVQPHRAPFVKIQLGTYGGTDFSNPNVLHFTQNSPYVALCLAIHMGVARIGLIGVDFTADHFFGKTGVHPLTPRLRQIDAEYARMRDACRARGIEVFNLSSVSRLTAFPRKPLATFIGESSPRARPADPLRIVSYATTPVAGVPSILARCISAQTRHQARCVWATNDYGNGVRFDGDLEWRDRADASEVDQTLAAADVVVVHNGKVEDRHRSLLAGKLVLTMAHNYAWNVDTRFVENGMPGLVVGQYQATLAEFSTWTVVPNPIPLWEPAFSPNAKDDRITIAYTPSGRHERYPYDHRLFWHGKGYETTTRILDSLGRRHPINVITIRNTQLSHADALAAKRRAHIVIDECVTGSYHRNSLEGLAAGCVVVNGVGLRPAIGDMLSACAGGAPSPFVHAKLDTLEAELERLIGLGSAALETQGAASRRWLEQHWSFPTQWRRVWQPAIDAALMRSRLYTSPQAIKRLPTSASAARIPAPIAARPVSVVIPHGGRERLGLLAATLGTTVASDRVGEVIVAEMDDTPRAEEVARRHGVGYFFIYSNTGFNKARTINAATELASSEFVLWLDNDLLLPDGFLATALAELQQRQLDCLIPWTSVHYLGAEDSGAVIGGTLRPERCHPVNTMHTRGGACGGAVLLRRRLIQQFGGMCETFKGWGGEDNAWFHKARVVGRAAITQRRDQHLLHLFHEHSGGYAAGQQMQANPHYQDNVRLLYAMRRISDRASFLQRYPVPEHATCPWPRARRIALVADPNDSWAAPRLHELRDRLKARYGIEVSRKTPDEALDAEAVVVFAAAADPAPAAEHALHNDGPRPRSIVVGPFTAACVTTAPVTRRYEVPDTAGWLTTVIAHLSVILGTSADDGTAQSERRPAPSRASAPTALVAAASGIGDLIRATPLIRVLAQMGHRVDFLVAPDDPGCIEIFRGAPEIHRIIVCPPIRRQNVAQDTAELGGDDYDIAVLTHLAASLGPRVRAQRRRVVDRARWLAAGDSACGEIIARELGWQHAMPAPIACPSTRRFDLPAGTVVLHPGCKPNWPWKRWHGFPELAGAFGSVAIVGTPDDQRNAGTYFARENHWPAHVRDYTGRLDLKDTAALISQAAALVANDSGLMHLGVAVGTPTFGIFGITNPGREIVAAPYMYVISKGLSCESACRAAPYGRRDCERHLECLKQLRAEEVALRVKQALPHVSFAPPPSAPSDITATFPRPRIPSESISVAARIDGGIGDVLLASPLLQRLFDELQRCEIDVFYHQPEAARFIFHGARFVRSVHAPAHFDPHVRHYDLEVRTLQFVQYIVRDWSKLHRVSPSFAVRVRELAPRFESVRGLAERQPQLDGLWGRMSVEHGRNVLDNIGYLGGVDVRRDSTLFLAPDPTAYAVLEAQIGGFGARYITLHDGFDNCHGAAPGMATKCWPMKHWQTLVAALKSAHPDVRLVQMGAKKSRHIPGVHVDLVDRTSLHEAAWILKNALLHIDTDSGLAHLARALRTPAVVLFGPTDARYYGHQTHLNLEAKTCSACWWSTPDWLSRCPRGLAQPECMDSITPDSVLASAATRLAAMKRVTAEAGEAVCYDTLTPADRNVVSRICRFSIYQTCPSRNTSAIRIPACISMPRSSGNTPMLLALSNGHSARNATVCASPNLGVGAVHSVLI